ncbi:MAG: hypothetical protein WC789_09220 [Lentisphaeria bacterium]
MNTTVPIHQWTHTGDKVLVLKCVGADMRGHGGFPYPASGPVECPAEWRAEWGGEKPGQWRGGWTPDTRCGAGLHGWAWGLGVGDGRNADYNPAMARWLVVACAPADVVGNVGDGQKVKFRAGTVVYCGDWRGAYGLVIDGLIAWITSGAGGNAAASGEKGNAAASGEKGNAAASGWSGNAAASGAGGNAAASGENSKAAAGPCAVAAASAEGCTVTCEYGGLCAVVAEGCYWIPEPETVLVQRWVGQRGWQTAVLVPTKAEIGKTLHIVAGKRVTE